MLITDGTIRDERHGQRLTAITYLNINLMNKYNLITILGPTATGKTRLASMLAHNIGGEIISADSRQVYRCMNLGTGKDYDDYKIDNAIVPYHLIDITDAGTHYNVYRFRNDFTAAFRDITYRNKIPILCGGTGLYIEAVLKTYLFNTAPPDEKLRKDLENKTPEELTSILVSMGKLQSCTDVKNPRRLVRAIETGKYNKPYLKLLPDLPLINSIIFGVDCGRETRRKNITERLKSRLDNGMIEEVKSLINTGLKPEQLMYYGLEYKYITLYVTGKLTYIEMFRQLETAIHRFAKRQMAWFRRMEKQGMKIHWIDGNLPPEERLNHILDILQ